MAWEKGMASVGEGEGGGRIISGYMVVVIMVVIMDG